MSSNIQVDTGLSLPGAELTAGKMPGHWLLARLGKRVLRPGGLELTRSMLHSLGVRHSDAGIAAGLINTSQQIGGAIGVAAVTTIAATSTSHYLAAHPGAAPAGGPALTHGFSVGCLSHS